MSLSCQVRSLTGGRFKWLKQTSFGRAPVMGKKKKSLIRASQLYFKSKVLSSPHLRTKMVLNYLFVCCQLRRVRRGSVPSLTSCHSGRSSEWRRAKAGSPQRTPPSDAPRASTALACGRKPRLVNYSWSNKVTTKFSPTHFFFFCFCCSFVSLGCFKSPNESLSLMEKP